MSLAPRSPFRRPPKRWRGAPVDAMAVVSPRRNRQMDTIATPPVLSAQEVSAYLAKEFPQIGIGRNFSVEAVGPMTARLRLHYRADHLRPGGTISGPTIFALADVALYVVILA